MSEPKIRESMLPRFSVSRPVTVAMIVLTLLVVGGIAYFRIKMDLFPSGLSVPYMGVWVPYPDANPKEIEEQIVKPMEGELKTIKNLKRLHSMSSTRGCNFELEFSQGTNMDVAYAQVSDRVERVKPLIPADQDHIYIFRYREGDEPIVYMGISFDDSVKDPFYASDKFIKQAVNGIKGVANVELFGMREKYVQIIVDTDKVRTYRINLPMLMETLLKDNFAMSSGYVTMGKSKYMLRTKSRFNNLEDIKKIEIGNGVRLENIADVVYDFDEEKTSLMRVDGKVAAGMVVYKESESNTVEVCNRVREKLDDQIKNRPELKGVDYFIFWDQGREINDSIGNVKTSMLWGGLFSFLVLLYFLRKFNITLMLTLAIPLSMLISILGMYALGWTLNAFTMMGLMISIGMVVDNSIVITENIYRFNGMGYSKVRAAVLGASEVGLAIVMATLTTVVVFLPMMIMSGNSFMSFYLTRIGVPVIFAILGSLFIALILIPLASIKTIPLQFQIRQATHSVPTQWYQNVLVKVLKHRRDAVIVIMLLIFSMMIPLNMMKKSDMAEGGPRDAKVICTFPSNYSVEKVDKTLAYISNKLMQKRDLYHIDHISTRSFKLVGRLELYLKPDPDTQWYQSTYRKLANALGFSHYKRLTREELTEDIKKNLPEIPGVEMRTTWRQTESKNSALEYNLTGYDITVLEEIARELERQIRQVEGVLTVENDMETGNDEVHIAANRDQAFKLGTNPNYLGQLVRFALGRRKISNYQTPDREIEIYVKSRADQRQTVAQLKNTFIKTSSETETNLAAIADITYHKSMGQLRRENGKSSMQLRAFIGEADIKKIAPQLEKILKNYQFPTGYGYEKGGRFDDMMEQDQDIQSALIFSIVLVILIMGVLFESFILPLSVLIAIPAAFFGAFWLLFITGTSFEIMAGIGLVILVGVVVNNAIVLIDLINQYRNEGMQREQAILVAGMHRFRPILMTALTTIFGLVPMAVGNTGLVGIPYAPMGITLIGGMVSSTFLTLFAVPVFYTYFDDMRHFFPVWLKRFI